MRIERTGASVPMTIGKLVHSGLDSFYCTDDVDSTLQTLGVCIEQLVESLLFSPEDLEYIAHASRAMLLGHIRLVSEYLKKHNLVVVESELELDLPMESLMPKHLRETVQDMNLPKFKFIFDQLAARDSKKQMFFLENKTGRSINDGELDTLDMDIQLRTYGAALRYYIIENLYPDCKPAGCVYLRTNSPSIRRRVKAGEDPGQFLDRLMKDYQDPERYDNYYSTRLVRFPERICSTAAKELLSWVRYGQGLLEAFGDQHNKYPKRRANCRRYNRACDFMPICRDGISRSCNLYQPRKDRNEDVEETTST